MSYTSLPVVLSVAGSDCSAGAGIQADLKTFTHFKVYGVTALSCVVAEIPGKVSQIQAVSTENIADQLKLLLRGFPVAAMKTGMLFSEAIIRIVAGHLKSLAPAKRPRLVVDPVMVATSGEALIKPDAITAYQTTLFPMAELITPNMDEAGVLLGSKITDESQLADAARALHKKFKCAILVKGGHLKGKNAVDVLCDKKGAIQTLKAPYVTDFNTHGTGCTYSAAIAAGMANGQTLPEAVAAAKKYVTKCITTGLRWSEGKVVIDALRHF
jgi:hydroxymethylpyrimidine/phosphomethylpyrimidine kinase